MVLQKLTAALAMALLMVFGTNVTVDAVESRPFYSNFLFFPKKHTRNSIASKNGMSKQDVYIRSPEAGRVIHGWFFRSETSPYVVLLNHGNSGNLNSVEWLIDSLAASGVSVLAYDYRGYGLSPGIPTVDSICSDGLAAYDYLVQEQRYRPDQIILYGQSIGTGVACYISSQRESLAIILQSGFSSLKNVAMQRVPWLRTAVAHLLPDKLDNGAVLARAHPPLLLIHGTGDSVVPASNSTQMYALSRGQKRLVLIEGGSHALFPEAVAEHRIAVSSFITELTAREYLRR